MVLLRTRTRTRPLVYAGTGSCSKLRPHVASSQIPLRQARMVVPQCRPRARILAVLLLQPATELLRGEDEIVPDAQALEVGKQVEQEVNRNGPQRLDDGEGVRIRQRRRAGGQRRASHGTHTQALARTGSLNSRRWSRVSPTERKMSSLSGARACSAASMTPGCSRSPPAKGYGGAWLPGDAASACRARSHAARHCREVITAAAACSAEGAIMAVDAAECAAEPAISAVSTGEGTRRVTSIERSRRQRARRSL